MEDLVSLTEKFFQNKHQEEELNASRDLEKLLCASKDYMIKNPKVLPVLRLDSRSVIEKATQESEYKTLFNDKKMILS